MLVSPFVDQFPGGFLVASVLLTLVFLSALAIRRSPENSGGDCVGSACTSGRMVKLFAARPVVRDDTWKRRAVHRIRSADL